MAHGGRVCFLFLVWLATFIGVHGASTPSLPGPAPGPDCMDSSTGQVVPAGKTVETEPGKKCYCPTASENYGGHPEPMCHYSDFFITTTPQPSPCYANGHYYQEGEFYEIEPCLTCYCRSYGQGPECSPPACTIPLCPHPVSNGYCCPTCSNGPACLGLHGDEIPRGETKTYPDGSQCYCDYPSFHNGLECTPIDPTSAAPPTPPARRKLKPKFLRLK